MNLNILKKNFLRKKLTLMLTDFVRKIYVCLPKITYINLDDGFLVGVGSEFCHVQFFDVPIESLKQE